MACHLAFNTGSEEHPLATLAGWGDFCRYVDTLPADDFGQLVHLVEHGWCQQLAALTVEIERALAQVPPAAPDVAKTARGLLALLQNRPDAATVAGIVND